MPIYHKKFQKTLLKTRNLVTAENWLQNRRIAKVPGEDSACSGGGHCRQPDFVCCKALKCLALIRLSREDEASPILDSILEKGTTDEGALQAMNIAYRELHQSKLEPKMAFYSS